MSADFDEIFGDLKEDQQLAPALVSDFDADAIFGDVSLGDPIKTGDVLAPEKPCDASMTSLAPPPALVPTPSDRTSPFSGEQASGSSKGTLDGSGDQDDFLSWLDDTPKAGGADGAAQRMAAPVVSSADVGDAAPAFVVKEEEQPSATVASTAQPSTPPETVALEEPQSASPTSDEAIEPVLEVAAPAVGESTPALSMAPTSDEISLDDDDDDDYLEKIVQNANRKQQAGSREASSSSLAIKSHGLAQHMQIDPKPLLQAYLETGTVSPVTRLALWKHCVQETSKSEPLSMYALQTTALDLPSQPLLRKEVESQCAAIFASRTHREVVEAAAERDEMDGARLLFLDSVEILLTHLCKSLGMDYSPGLARTLAPLLAAGGSDPLRLELVDTLRGVCRRFLPHLGRTQSADAGGEDASTAVKLARVAAARRALLHPLLLYHSPALARHLERRFPTWTAVVKDDRGVSGGGGGAIPDTWLASFFESERHSASLDGLVGVWDCCLLLGPALGAAESESLQHMPSFVAIHLVMRAEKALLRMEGDQLRHCMAQTLVEALQRESDALLAGVRALVEATPPGFIARLQDGVKAMMELPPPLSPDAGTKSQAPAAVLSPMAGANNGLAAMSSLLTASANGVKELSTAMIDMPAKLLAIGPIKPLSLAQLGFRSDDTLSVQTAQELFFLHAQALEAPPAAMELETRDVVPLVFRSFQSSPAPPSSPMLRFFIVDCRARAEDGQVPTAFRLDPDDADPDALDLVMATLEPLKHSAHFAVMGAGYAQVAAELRQLPEPQLQQYQQQQTTTAADGSGLFAFNEAFLEALASDQRRMQAVVELLTARGFSKVSVLANGFSGAHDLLRDSLEFSTADLVDHDASRCAMCAHHERLVAVRDASGARTRSGVLLASLDDQSQSQSAGRKATATATASESASVSAGVTGSSLGDRSSSRSSSSSSSKAAPTRTASGRLDAKALFDAHAAAAATASPNYLSSFAGALKTGGKTLLNPGDSLKEGTKWLKKKSSGEAALASASLSPTAGGSAVGGASGSGSPAVALGIGGLSKLRHSLAHIGSESIDMLRKAEQAAAAKSRLSFGSPAPGASGSKPPAGPPGLSTPAPRSTSSSTSLTSASIPATGDRHASFQPSEDEVFTIDDEEEEEQDDFVGGGGGAHVSSAALRSGSFHRDGSLSDGLVLHDVAKGRVSELRKGMRVSRSQMLPCADSPFFSGYKKKKAGDKTVMLPRRLVLMESHLVVLKAERGADDVYAVKSNHPLAHVARMTCLKKNALMVTVYHKWQPEGGSAVVERRNAYEVQQRDEFIRAIKAAMDKL